ncbi:MAG: hypothetical protein QOF37_2204 [Thermoleophilaceae bacterium]|nr:hypothetical protein [Thermoleophilaceae bacterium]
MPRVTRAATVNAPPDDVWRLVSDPHSLPRWWPAVVRVEDVTEDEDAWTNVMRTPKGRSVRADYTRTDLEPPRRVAWRQELVESPFERILAAAETEIALAGADGGGTRVALTSSERLRGRFRLGGFMVRRATRRRLDEALAGLEQAVGGQ